VRHVYPFGRLKKKCGASPRFDPQRCNAREHSHLISPRTGSVDDRTASQVAKEAISVEQDEAKLLKKTFRQACQVVSTAQAARYLQLEAKTRAEIRYAEAESVPLVN